MKRKFVVELEIKDGGKLKKRQLRDFVKNNLGWWTYDLEEASITKVRVWDYDKVMEKERGMCSCGLCSLHPY